MSNIILHNLNKIKNQNLGLGSRLGKNRLVLFGLANNWHISSTASFKFKQRQDIHLFALPRVEKFLKESVLQTPSLFNFGLQKRIARRIEFLKLNRSWRGVRHSQALPTRGQRTRTNARTRKSRRKAFK